MRLQFASKTNVAEGYQKDAGLLEIGQLHRQNPVCRSDPDYDDLNGSEVKLNSSSKVKVKYHKFIKRLLQLCDFCMRLTLRS